MRTRAARRLRLLLATASLACASAPPSAVDRSVDAVRDRDGVCASGSFAGRPPHRATLTACLRIGARGTPFDNSEARLITLLRAEDELDANLTDWQVMVERDGERVMNRALEAGPSHRRCTFFGLSCRGVVADVASLPGGPRPGTYTLRYRVMNAEAYAAKAAPVELTIVLR